MFARLGNLVVRRPWWTIGAWLLIIVAVVSMAPQLTSTTDQSAFLPSHYESIQAAQLQEKAFPHAAAPAAIVVFERTHGAALSAADETAVGDIAGQLNQVHLKDVTGVQAVPPPDNRLIQIAAVQMIKVTDPSDTRQSDAVKPSRMLPPHAGRVQLVKLLVPRQVGPDDLVGHKGRDREPTRNKACPAYRKRQEIHRPLWTTNCSAGRPASRSRQEHAAPPPVALASAPDPQRGATCPNTPWSSASA